MDNSRLIEQRARLFDLHKKLAKCYLQSGLNKLFRCLAPGLLLMIELRAAV